MTRRSAPHGCACPSRASVRAVAHIALVGLATYHVVLFNAINGATQRQLGQNFQTLFLPEDAGRFKGDPTDTPAGDRVFLFSADDVRAAVELMLERYWDLPVYALAPVEIAVAGSGVGTVLPARGAVERTRAAWRSCARALRLPAALGGGASDLPPSDGPLPLPTVTYTFLSDAAEVLEDPAARGVGVATTATEHALYGPGDTFPFNSTGGARSVAARGARRAPRGRAARARAGRRAARASDRGGRAEAAQSHAAGSISAAAGAAAGDDADLFRSLVSLRYELPLRLRDPAVAAAAAGCGDRAAPASGAPLSLMPCGEWRMRLTFDFSGRGQVEVTWAATLVRRCAGAGIRAAGGGIAPPVCPASGGSPPVGGDGDDVGALAAACALALLACLVHEAVSASMAVGGVARFARAAALQRWARGAAGGQRWVNAASDGSDDDDDSDGGAGGGGVPRSASVYSSTPLLLQQQTQAQVAGKPVAGTGAAQTSPPAASAAAAAAAAAAPALALRLRWWHPVLLADPWVVCASAGSLCLLAHCLVVLDAGVDMAGAGRGAPLAAAAFLLWASVVQHARSNRRLFSNVLTLAEAAPRVAALLIAPAPIFVAIALFALVVFGHTCVVSRRAQTA